MLLADKSRPHPFVFPFILVLLAVMVVSFIPLSFPPASGFAASVPNTASGNATTSQAPTLALTVNAATDVIVFGWNAQTHQTGSYPTIGATVSDSCGDTYQNIGSNLAKFFSSPNYFVMTEGMVSASALCSGAVTITLTLTGLAPTASGFAAVDIKGASGASPLTRSVGSSCNSSCASPQVLVTPMNFSAGGVAVVFGEGFNTGTQTPTSASYTALTGTSSTFMMYSTTITSPDSGSIDTTVAAGTFWSVGAIWGTSASSSTTTVVANTTCLGTCSGSANATSTYFSTSMPKLFVFYASQNTASTGQIDNFTMKVKAVHINAASGSCFIGVYQADLPTTVPSGGNPYDLVKSMTVTVYNGTTNFFIHANPQVNLDASAYYLAGIMCGSTASRGSGATGSGVSFYESSQAGVVEYQYDVAASALPASFYSNTVMTPNFFMQIHETYNVATITTTSTSTLTGTGTFTATTTSTVTSTTLDMNLAVQSGTDYGILLLVILLPAMAIAVPVAAYTKSGTATGVSFVAGLMLGSALGVQAALVPPVFLGITVVIGIFMIVGLTRGGGGP